MKRLFCFLLAMFLISSFAYASGKLKILLADEFSTVYIDNKQFDAIGEKQISFSLAEGEYLVKVKDKDGNTTYSKKTVIIEGEIAVIDVETQAQKAKPKTEVIVINTKAEQKEENKKEWGTGWGLSIGADNTNYSQKVLGISATIDLGTQLDLDWFYAGKLSDGVYTDFSISLLRTSSSYDNSIGTKTSVTSFPISSNFKFNVNENVMLGVGANYSLWSASAQGANLPAITPGIGYQIFAEIKPISSEIGYIVKNGSLTYGGIDATLTSAGIYYKYKFYF